MTGSAAGTVITDRLAALISDGSEKPSGRWRDAGVRAFVDTVGVLLGGAADPAVALPSVELRALSRDVAQPLEHGRRALEQRVTRGAPGELGEPGSEQPPALAVAGEQAVHLERDGQPVRRGARQPGALGERREGGCSALDGLEDETGHVQNPTPLLRSTS